MDVSIDYTIDSNDIVIAADSSGIKVAKKGMDKEEMEC